MIEHVERTDREWIEILYGVVAAQNVLLNLPVNLRMLAGAHHQLYGKPYDGSATCEEVARRVLRAFHDI
jgi:hypothetical protein